MPKCKWCKESYNPDSESEAFCPRNPNRVKNRKMFFSGSKVYSSLRKESTVVITAVVVPPSPFRGR